MIRLTWSCPCLLVLVAVVTTSRAESPCSESLQFARDGSIADWTTCHNGVPQTFVSPGGNRLSIEFSIDDEPLTLEWQRMEGKDEAVTFRAVDYANSLEVLRKYQPDSDTSLVHTISVRNPSTQSVSGVWLAMRPGGPIQTRHDSGRSLADYVYGFHRAEIAVDDGRWAVVNDGDSGDVLAITSRHKAFVIDSARTFSVQTDIRPPGSIASIDASNQWILGFDVSRIGAGETRSFQQRILALPVETQALAAAGYSGLMYSNLWPPLAVLCEWIERLFAGLSAVTGAGFAVILLALAVRLATLPVSLWSARKQREFVRIEDRIKPAIADVRANYKGAEQSERILEIYRDNNISPFSGLKGSVSLFIQIPFLLAVFNVTTASGIFAGESFLWIDDLSLPDTAAMLPFSVTMLGNHLNALPIALGIFNLFSVESRAGGSLVSRSMPVIVTLLIMVVFYSFAAALVLYWLTVNVIQAGERLLFRKADDDGPPAPANAGADRPGKAGKRQGATSPIPL